MQKGKSDPLRNKGERLRFEAALRNPQVCNPIFYDIWVVCFGMGLRGGDGLALKFSDFDDFGRLTYTPQKQKRFDSSGNPRALVTVNCKPNKRVLETIRRRKRLARRGQIYVFESNWGRGAGRHEPYTRKRVWEVWKAAASAARIEGLNIGFHTSRKTYGRDVYYGTGKDIGATCKALRHADAKATLHYLGIEEDNIAALSAAFGQ
jgi:integrase